MLSQWSNVLYESGEVVNCCGCMRCSKVCSIVVQTYHSKNISLFCLNLRLPLSLCCNGMLCAGFSSSSLAGMKARIDYFIISNVSNLHRSSEAKKVGGRNSCRARQIEAGCNGTASSMLLNKTRSQHVACCSATATNSAFESKIAFRNAELVLLN